MAKKTLLKHRVTGEVLYPVTHKNCIIGLGDIEEDLNECKIVRAFIDLNSYNSNITYNEYQNIKDAILNGYTLIISPVNDPYNRSYIPIEQDFNPGGEINLVLKTYCEDILITIFESGEVNLNIEQDFLIIDEVPIYG